ncbi:MAG: F0F1 ATP synthase subunit A [Weeksellaceae bacterium]
MAAEVLKDVVTETNQEVHAETAAQAEVHAGPHISIKGEEVFEVAGIHVTNSVITTSLVVILFIFIAKYYYDQSRKTDRGLGFYAINTAVKGIYDLFESVLHKKINIFFPLLGAFFFFILLNNWSGLIPGVGTLLLKSVHDGVEHTVPLFRGGTADLNTTLALALVSVIATQIYGLRMIGLKSHVGKYLNFSSPISAFMGILEVVQEFSRILSFSFRLYGNIFAGEVLLSIIPFLLPMLLSFVSTPMYFMEVFVGGVQALVFSMLTAVFISMAISEHH